MYENIIYTYNTRFDPITCRRVAPLIANEVLGTKACRDMNKLNTNAAGQLKSEFISNFVENHIYCELDQPTVKPASNITDWGQSPF